MNPTQSWQLLLVAVAGCMNRHQQDVIDDTREENSLFNENLLGKRIRFTDDERRRLAVKGKILGRKTLTNVASIVTPDTLLRWHRKLVAMKYDGSARRGSGRAAGGFQYRQRESSITRLKNTHVRNTIRAANGVTEMSNWLERANLSLVTRQSLTADRMGVASAASAAPPTKSRMSKYRWLQGLFVGVQGVEWQPRM